MHGLAELLIPAMTNLKTGAEQAGPTQTGTEGNVFPGLLGQMIEQGRLEGARAAGSGEAPAETGLAQLLAALTSKNTGNLFKTGEASAGRNADGASNGKAAGGGFLLSLDVLTGQAGTSASAGRNADGASHSKASAQSLDSRTQVESLLLGLAALLTAKTAHNEQKDDTAPPTDSASQGIPAAGLEGLSSLIPSGKGKGAQPGNDGASSSPAGQASSKDDGTGPAGSLALLIFESLQAILGGTQDQAASGAQSASGTPLGQVIDQQGPAALASAEGKGASAASAAKTPKDALKAVIDGSAGSDAGPKADSLTASPGVEKHFPTSAVDQASAPTWETALGQARISLIPAGQAGETDTLSLVVKGSPGQGQGSGGKSGAGTGSVKSGIEGETGLADGTKMTIVKDLAALIEASGEGGSQGSGSDKDRSLDSQASPLAADKEASSLGVSADDQKGTAPQQAISTGSVARFEQIMGQLGGKTGSHDLLVRLDMGSDDNLVLGLKDLGQSVTVEVRASNQGMINLLESQRDMIVRHLEGKDIHTTIVIDPNASGTPDKRDRGEPERQRAFPSASQKTDGGFAELLNLVV